LPGGSIIIFQALLFHLAVRDEHARVGTTPGSGRGLDRCLERLCRKNAWLALDLALDGLLDELLVVLAT